MGTIADVISWVRREARRRLPDLTDEEFNRAVPDLLYSHEGPAVEETVARVRAYREARQRRPDLAPDEFAWLYGIVSSQLADRTDADEIVAKVNAVRPPPAPSDPESPTEGPPRLPTSRARHQLEQAIEQLHKDGNEYPTQAEIAAAHDPEIAERTLRSRLKAEAGLHDLLPRRSRSRPISA